MTPTELRTHQDKIAAVLALSDGELDRLAAEMQGWEKGKDDGVYCDPNDAICLIEDYCPSRDLGQAYELLEKAASKLGEWIHSRSMGGHWIIDIGEGHCVDSEEARTHARAVAALAIVGLCEVGE